MFHIFSAEIGLWSLTRWSVVLLLAVKGFVVAHFTLTNSMWCYSAASLLLHLSHSDMILYFYSLKWHINASINNSNGTQVLADSLMMEMRMMGSMEGLKLVSSCRRIHSRSLSFFLLLAGSASATLLINTQGYPSDIQWPAWVSPALNNKLFGFGESGLRLTPVLFSRWPHCSFWRELWRCG